MTNQTYTEFINNHKSLIKQNTEYIKRLDHAITKNEIIRLITNLRSKKYV